MQRRRLRRGVHSRIVILLGSAVTLTALVIGLWPRSRSAAPANKRAAATSSKSAGRARKNPLKRPATVAAARDRAPSLQRTGPGQRLTCQFQTVEPGFIVLIDGVPARDESGELLLTPCEVEVPQGQHTFTLAKEKYAEHVEQTHLTRPRTFEAAPLYDPFAEPQGYFASRFAQSAVGTWLELHSVDPGGPAWDPYISEDGLTLWFAADGREGKGIYAARRESLLQEFGPSRNLARMADLPVSPVPTADQLLVAYAVRDKAQIRSLVRDDVDDPFRQGPVLRASESAAKNWPSVWISADGRNLVWSELHGDAGQFFAADRQSRHQGFATLAPLKLPGNHPRLSGDGLRQCLVEERKVLFAERAATNATFTSRTHVGILPEGVNLNEKDRWFWPSADYQWLYYASPVLEGGKLFALRISDRPQFGYAPTGRPIAQRLVAAAEEEVEPPARADTPAAPADPRSGPLPYASFRRRLQQALAASDFAQAQELIVQARNDRQLADQRGLIDGDAREVLLASAFWSRLREALAGLPSGSVLRSGTLRIAFERFEEETIHGKTPGGGTEVSKRLVEIPPADLAAIVDQRVARDDQQAQLEIAAFLATRARPNAALVRARLARAGDAGREYEAQQHARTLSLIEQEIARENLGAALESIDRLAASHPKTEAAARALALREGLYTRMAWRPVGIQNWEHPEPGEYSATRGRAANSYLTSPSTFGNFLLALEWKTTTETAQGGVFFRYDAKGDFRKGAWKLQLANDYAIRESPDQFSTGSLFGKRAPRFNPVKPSGEWNTLELRVERDRVKATINGTLALDTALADPNMPQAGYICLDGEQGGISYRRILLYELPQRGVE